ncbi:hypothetical protein NC652_029373 [Populus alba x Populus x berolinensis]|nr:hypothetical protein NC652_029373 [Populus alba x Populus x berolinensis]
MPNDVVLDTTVHHLFAEDQFNKGKSSRSWLEENPVDYGHYIHDVVNDLSPPRCPPFLEAGTQDLLWLYKSQRKAYVKGGQTSRRKNEQGEPKQKRKRDKKCIIVFGYASLHQSTTVPSRVIGLDQ